MERVPTQRRLTIVILVVVILIAAVLRVTGIAGKRTIHRAEGISYLSATGHQGSYYSQGVGGPVTGNWVRASEWKRFLQPEQAFCFRQIGSDLAHTDIHPPLYFWLLHLWSLPFGVNLWTGPSLNVFLVLITTLALFGFARYVLGNAREAILVAFAWAVSPAVVRISFEARQYDLLALCTVLFAWQVVRFTDRAKQFNLRDYVLLGAFATLGALTHYHFSVFVLGCVGFSTVRLVKNDRYRLAGGLLSVGLGYVVFYLCHPHFYLSFKGQQAAAQDFNLHDIIPRIWKVVDSFLGFVVYGGRIRYVALLLCALFIVGILIAHFNKSVRLAGFANTSTESVVLRLLSWTAGTTVLLYLASISPQHAMGGRYLSATWPLLAFIPVFILRLWPRARAPWAMLYCAVLLLFAGRSVSDYVHFNRDIDSSDLLSNSDRIVVDNVSRIAFTRIFWHSPDDTLMYAAKPSDLLATQDDWLGHVTSGSIYVSLPFDGNTVEQQREILDLLSEQYRLTAIEGGIYGLGDVFEINQR